MHVRNFAGEVTRSRPQSLAAIDPTVSFNNINLEHWQHRFEQYRQALAQQPCDRLLLCHPDPTEFLAGFWAAITTQTPVFLGNPHWRSAQWQQVGQQVQPQKILGDAPCQISTPSSSEPQSQPLGQIMIPTGGSSGQIRFAMHTPATLSAAVVGCQQFFDVEQIHSYCILPLYHVSGLMQVWRSLLTGGICVLGSYAQLKQGHWPDVPFAGGFLSLVPTQLQQILRLGGAGWLRQFETVLLGGSPPWPELLAQARSAQIRLAPTYGMTETAAQVVTLRPEDFLAGNPSTGQVLPHAQIQLDAQSRLGIAARSRCLGYYPEPWPVAEFWLTDDLGQLDDQGYLTITGRQSRKIISGGENIFPEVIEAVLRDTGLVLDVCVVGVPDAHWGEAIAVAYVPGPGCDRAQLTAAVEQQCGRWLRPRHWHQWEQLPQFAQGKVQYAAVQALILAQCATVEDCAD